MAPVSPQRAKLAASSDMSETTFKQRTHRGVASEEVDRVGRVAGNVAVADEHGHVGGQALGAEGGRREVRRHREEDDGAAVEGGQDRGLLAAGDVDADDGEVGGSTDALERLAAGATASAATSATSLTAGTPPGRPRRR